MGKIDKKKLCDLAEKKYPKKKTRDYGALVAGAEYVCEKCGRGAAKKHNLCKPVKIEV